MDASLYYSRSSLGAAEGDSLVLALILLGEVAYVKADYEGASEVERHFLNNFGRAGLIVPWDYPFSDEEIYPDWVHASNSLLRMEEATYGDYEALVVDTLDGVRTAQASGDHIPRIADLVDCSNELWLDCVAAHLGATSVVGGRGRVGRLAHDHRQGEFRITVVQEFLRLQQLSADLRYLSVEDVLDLRRRYGRRIGELLGTLLAELPSSGPLAESSTSEGCRRLLEEYDREVVGVVQGRRPRKGALAGAVALDLIGFKLSPVGAVSVLGRLFGHGQAVRSYPLLWFVSELKETLGTRVPQV